MVINGVSVRVRAYNYTKEEWERALRFKWDFSSIPPQPERIFYPGRIKGSCRSVGRAETYRLKPKKVD